MKNLLKNFNSKQAVLVITSFPNPINGKFGKREFNAVGEHSERRLPYLAKHRPVLVCAEDIGTKKSFSPSKNILVTRLWKKGSIKSLIHLAKFAKNQDQIESVLVQFEFNLLGGILNNLVLLLILAYLRFHGKKITFELHQVLTNIGDLKRHININNLILQKIYNGGLKAFYRAVGFICNDVIVFEEEMKIRLKQFVKESKIHVLSLSVDQQKTISKQQARKKLGLPQHEFTLLVFGYINGYKGIDWILDALKNSGQDNIRLVIAGGQNPYLKDKPFYQRFYNSILKKANEYNHVTYSNFIPDKHVHVYYSAADIVIMPYIAFMSASGPFSRALAHQKPILISEKLADYAKTADFTMAQKKANLSKKDIVFKLDSKSLITLIKRAQNDTSYYEQLVDFSITLGNFRSMDEVTSRLNSILAPNRITASSRKLSRAYLTA